MFNLSKLKIVNPSLDKGIYSSFVGIRRGYNDELEFCLPKGFEKFNSSFDNLKKLFFSMYSTFKKFEKQNNTNIDLFLDEKTQNKDNINKVDNAYRFKDNEDNEVILYSKISLIESMLDAYLEFSLNDIKSSITNNEEINYDLIEYYLDKAIYLDNNMIYIDNMESNHNTIKYDSTELIEMFCFIIREIFTEMAKKIDYKVDNLAFNFSSKFLTSEAKLFDEFNFEATICTLKDILVTIDRSTGYKDSEYWLLFNAIENFLYGELDTKDISDDGVYWGINNFYQIWEDICNKSLLTEFKSNIEYDLEKIIYCDTRFDYYKNNLVRKKFGKTSILIDKDFENPFYFSFRQSKRWMRPDVVIEKNFILEKIYTDKIISVSYTSPNSLGRSDITIKLSSKASNTQKRYFDTLCTHISSLRGKEVKGARVLNSRNNSHLFELKNYSIEYFNYIKNLPIENYYKKHIKYLIIDWKYLSLEFFNLESIKLKNDLSKQLSYEYCLQQTDKFQNKKLKIGHQYGIPYFTDSTDLYTPLNSDNFLKNEISEFISIIGINFTMAQNRYLEDD